jgi:asparagine N-glycosylation enzyme membrane subunit Stt3
MMNGMGSMMGGMTLAGWLGALLIGVLLIAAAVALVRLLSPKSIEGGASSVALIVLAVIGVLALLVTGGMLFMSWGMGGMMDR